jgi:hypothetical protein
MKRCWKCKEYKPLSEFNKDRSHHDGLMSMCKKCNNSRKRTMTPTRRAARRRTVKRHVKHVITPFIQSQKTGCSICGYNACLAALEFHHLYGKDWDISKMKWNIKTITEEIAKCVCLCANCHREVHAGMKSISSIHIACDTAPTTIDPHQLSMFM